MKRRSPLPHTPWAEVKAVNRGQQRVAIMNDWGYSIAEIRDGSLRVHDVIEGSVDVVGLATVRNQTSGQPVTVFVTHIQASRAGAAFLLARE